MPARSGVRCATAASISERLLLGNERLVLRRRRGQHGLGRLAAFHHIQQFVLERRLTSSQRRDLVLQALEFARRQTAGLQPGVITPGSRPHGVDVALEAALLVGDVAERGLRVDELVVGLLGATGAVGDRRELRQVRPPVRELGKGRVSSLQVEESQLGRGVGVHAGGLTGSFRMTGRATSTDR
jgi:hypothetical protein